MFIAYEAERQKVRVPAASRFLAKEPHVSGRRVEDRWRPCNTSATMCRTSNVKSKRLGVLHSFVSPQVLPRPSFQAPSFTTPPSLPVAPLPPSLAAGSVDAGKKSGFPKPACSNCRRSKVKCEGGIPCSRCVRHALQASCQRCEPKKRGRKRKNPLPDSSSVNPTPTQKSRTRRLKLPKAIQDHLPAASLETLRCLCSLLSAWESQAGQLVACQGQRAVRRLTAFVAYIQRRLPLDQTAFIKAEEPAQAAIKQLQLQLWSNVAAVVRSYNLDTEAPNNPAFTRRNTELENGVQYRVYDQLPMGVCSISLAGGATSFSNPRLAAMLGYQAQELAEIIQVHGLQAILSLSSVNAIESHMWNTIIKGASNTTIVVSLINRNGGAVPVTCTLWIDAPMDVPRQVTLFLQSNAIVEVPEPGQASHMKSIKVPKSPFAMPFTMPSYGPPPLMEPETESKLMEPEPKFSELRMPVMPVSPFSPASSSPMRSHTTTLPSPTSSFLQGMDLELDVPSPSELRSASTVPLGPKYRIGVKAEPLWQEEAQGPQLLHFLSDDLFL